MTSGILNVLKPPGMTSHDVVDFVRGLVPRGTKVGHAGTLDPAAAGVLVVCVGPATRLVEYLMECDKAYRAEIRLGVATDTLDAEGEVVSEADASQVTEAQAREAVGAVVGEQMMEPPMFSAARVDGKRLYDLAREGKAVRRPARPVRVHEAALVQFAGGSQATALADIRCSKGTYVRVLAAQVGQRLGVPAHLAFLVRTAVGEQKLPDAATMEELAEAQRREEWAGLLVPVEVALGHLPEVRLDEEARRAFRRGAASALAWGAGPADGGELVRVCGHEGELEGIGEVRSEEGRAVLQPKKVLTYP